MSARFVLRSPYGWTVTRGIVDGKWVEAPESADVTLGEGLWALPGLVDGHSHLAGDGMPHLSSPTDLGATERRAEEALEAGVTLLFDKGWSDETVLDLIDQVDPVRRPHIEAAGRMITNKGGYYEGFATEIDGSAIGAEVESAIGGRALWVKIVGDWPRPGMGPLSNFTEGELETAVEVATRLGARVAVHTMAREVPSIAVAAGAHSIEHGLFLTGADVDALGSRSGIWVPTLKQVEATASSLRPGSSGQALLRDGVSNACELVPAAIEAGVKVLAGTDMAVTSAEVAAEVLRLSECGISNQQALGIAGVAGHEAAGRSTMFEVGAVADAVMFPSNPLDDLAVLSEPVHVIRSGRAVR